MKKALFALITMVAVVAAVATWHAHRPRRTPLGQPPLESLNPESLSDFKEAFNSSPSCVRLVLLLSPT